MDLINNSNDANPSPIRQDVIDRVNAWRETPSDNECRWLSVSMVITRLEAVFIADNLRRELPLEGSGNNHQTTELSLNGGSRADGRAGFSDEAMDVFCGFLHETPCHLVSLRLDGFPHPQFYRLLRALHHNTSVKELQIIAFRENENEGALVEELLRHKTDFTNFVFSNCHFRISDALTGLLGGLTHLTKLAFSSSRIDDDAVQVILQGRYLFITFLSLFGNQITSVGLGIIARKIPQAFPSLEILGIACNPDLLDGPENNTRLFTQNVLPILKRLLIASCSKDKGYNPIIKSCEAETITKLEYLHFSKTPSVRNQLIESLPKMKVKRLQFDFGLFSGWDRVLMAALYKNTNIVELSQCDNSTRRHVAPILQRNKLLANIKKYLLGGTTMPPVANDDGAITITTLRGRWSRVLAEVGQATQGATPVYTILLAALAPWLEQTQHSQRKQQQDDDESRPIEPVAQSDTARAVRTAHVAIEDGFVGTATLDGGRTCPFQNDEAAIQNDCVTTDTVAVGGGGNGSFQSHDDSNIMKMDRPLPAVAAASAATASLTEEQQPCLSTKKRAVPTSENTTKKPKSDAI